MRRPLFSYKIFSNETLNWSILAGLALLVFTMAAPFMREIFHIPALPLYALPLIAFWLILNIFLVEGAKYIMRKKLI
ncbi:MAG: cation transporting ATPase C-terminal domain-containing protein [Patescibacteria group bacterium]